MHFPMDYLCTFLYHQKAHFQVSKSKSVKSDRRRLSLTLQSASKLNSTFPFSRWIEQRTFRCASNQHLFISSCRRVSEWVSQWVIYVFRISSKSSNLRWSRYQDNHDNYDNQDNQVRLALLWADFRIILIARQVFSCTALVTFPFQKGHWGQTFFTLSFY